MRKVRKELEMMGYKGICQNIPWDTLNTDFDDPKNEKHCVEIL